LDRSTALAEADTSADVGKLQALDRRMGDKTHATMPERAIAKE
jgi:hypothetical protein